MRLGIEARRFYGNQRTGIPNYLWNILPHLKDTLPELELFLYVPRGFDKEPLVALGDFTLRQRSAPLGMKGYFWTKFMAPKLVLEDQLDVFLAPRTLYPLGIAGKVPVVSVLHDLSYLIHPEVVPAGTLLNYRLWLRYDVRRADRMVAVSAGTSEHMVQLLGRSADAIVPPAVAPVYHSMAANEVANVRVRHGLPSPYLLFVGTLEPRKNLEALLDAHRIVNARRNQPLTLALAGQRGWRNHKLIARLDAGEPNVRELGYVPDEDLPALYNGAESFVIPSIYEGFGMPAAEARACGTRVVATDIPELREAAGPSATYVQPNAASIAKGIESALIKDKPAPERPWTWEDSAMKLAAVLEAAAAQSKPRT